MTSSLDQNAIIPIAPEFQEYIPTAILRLKYLFPDIECEPVPNGIRVVDAKGIGEARFSREIAYQVYREKIFRETLLLRQNLYQMLAT